MDDKKLAVLFPGIGYHCDKPLLYYSAKLARAAGYAVLPVLYAGFPEKVRGDGDKLRASFEIAWTQAEEIHTGGQRMKSTLIADTTREEREQIVAESIGNIDMACDGCSPGLIEMYRDYIEGRKELWGIKEAAGGQRKCSGAKVYRCIRRRCWNEYIR